MSSSPDTLLDLEKEQREHGVPKDAPEIDPFGDETNAEVKYRTLTWWQTSLLMIAETISLGILSLPSVLATIGMIPGIILLVGLGICATYTGYVFGQFKLAYPQVANMEDAGEVLLGPIGREIFGVGQVGRKSAAFIGELADKETTDHLHDLHLRKPSSYVHNRLQCHHRACHLQHRLGNYWIGCVLCAISATDVEARIVHVDRRRVAA